MPGDEEPTGNEEAVTLEQGQHPMTPTEAGMPSMADVIKQSQDTHRQVAIDMDGVEGFPDAEQD